MISNTYSANKGPTNTMSPVSYTHLDVYKRQFRDDSFIQDYMKKYDNRRKYAYKLFNNIPGVSMQMPESGFFVWIDISKLGDSSEITAYLAKEALVRCV